MNESKHGELTPTAPFVRLPDGEFRCTCGVVWDLFGIVQIRRIARPKDKELTALIPKGSTLKVYPPGKAINDIPTIKQNLSGEVQDNNSTTDTNGT